MDLVMLRVHGISPALAAHYARTEWLERLTIWATSRGVLPAWCTDRFPGKRTSLSLFDDATKARGIVTPPSVTDGVKVSS